MGPSHRGKTLATPTIDNKTAAQGMRLTAGLLLYTLDNHKGQDSFRKMLEPSIQLEYSSIHGKSYISLHAFCYMNPNSSSHTQRTLACPGGLCRRTWMGMGWKRLGLQQDHYVLLVLHVSSAGN
jgi:hypothetical protein